MLKYAVIGLGRFGGTLARELSGQGAEVIAIDTDEEALASVRDHVSVALRMDGTDERALREQGVDSVDIAVVGMAQRFEATQLATVVLRRMGIRRVIVKSATPLQDAILRRLGADEIISPEKESAVRLAQKLISPRILDYIELAEGHCLVQLTAPKKFHGKTIKALDVRGTYQVNIVAIRKKIETGRDGEGNPVFGEKVVDIPLPDHVFEIDDVLVVVGRNEDISRLAN